MTGETETPGPSWLTADRLRLVYVAGIALNVIALSAAAATGEALIAATFAFVIVYLVLRYRLIVSS